MEEEGAAARPAARGPTEVVRARRVEVVDESGQARILLGRLGEGEGAVFGLSVLAGDPSTGVHVTADDSSAGVALARRGDGMIDCRAFSGDGEVAAAVDIGAPAGGPVVSVEVAPDGRVTVRLREVEMTGG